uniref:C2 domain-containing protein n=1 Tax=Sander lucioperca TaxID=283035 RepID=A0A8C9YLW2_SANLU
TVTCDRLQLIYIIHVFYSYRMVFRLYAQGLYGDKWSQTDGSVEVSYGDMNKRTVIISNNDNPKWPETFEFGPIVINMKNRLKFSVYDEDSYWDSDLLGGCSFDLRRGKVSDSCIYITTL